MAWDGDWFGDWDGVWFGTTSTPPSSISGSSSGGGRLISAIIDQLPQTGWNSFRHDRRRHFTFVNLSGEEIPAYAALEIVAVDAEGTVYVSKPSQSDSNNVFINGPSKVPIDGYGSCTNHMPSWAYYNTADAAPANGESVGTRAGFWHLNLGYEGFKVWGGARNGIVFVQRDMTCRTLTSGRYYYNPETPCNISCCCWRCGSTRITNPADVTGFTGPTAITATVTTPCIGTPDTDTVTMNLTFCGCDFAAFCDDPGLDTIVWSGVSTDVVSGACGTCGLPLLPPISWADEPRLRVALLCTYGNATGRRFYLNVNHHGTSGAVDTTLLLIPGTYECDPFFYEATYASGFACKRPGPGGTLCTSCVGGGITVTLSA